MSTVALNNLWTYIESMGLSTKNRQWLADKLIEPAKEKSLSKSVDPFANFSNAWNDGISPEEMDADLRAHRNFARTVETW